ncbi:hypothetical protein SLOPH_1698 [Spraguea lophii 42_110]|uniref:K Homology domain-containing protein n=1 Tax=Spraguea lophii (strain 42_110) TaxID=1358809 RepID=S7WD79_SPRLO|nr:hypothetical protein SLOPH_1698 [Spraguea lophii 42_110]
MKEPKTQFFTYEEFIKYLNTDFKSFLELSKHNKEYLKNPLKNKRLGYNKYMQKEEIITEEIIIPKEKYKNIQNINYLENKYNIKIHHTSFDKNIILLTLEGTYSNILDFKFYLKEIIEEIPIEFKEMEISYIIVPNNKINKIIGKNGINLIDIQEITNTKIMVLPKDNYNKKMIIAGTLEDRRNVREMVYEILLNVKKEL